GGSLACSRYSRSIKRVFGLWREMPRRSTGHFVYNCARLRKSLKTFFAQKQGTNDRALLELCRRARKARGARRYKCSRADGGLSFFFDADFDLRGNVAEHLDGHLRLADDLDGFRELHLALVDLESLRGEPFRDVRGCHRAKHLIVLAGFARELQRCAVQQFSLLLPGLEFRRGLLGQRGANALDRFQVA